MRSAHLTPGAAAPSSDGGRRAVVMPDGHEPETSAHRPEGHGEPRLLTERLALTPVVQRDEQDLWTLHSDPAAFLHDSTPPLTDPAQMRWVLDVWRGQWERAGRGPWCVRWRDSAGERADGARGPSRATAGLLNGSPLLGVVAIAPLPADDPVAPQALNAYWRLAPAWHGHGIATEAMRALLQHPVHGPQGQEVLAVTSASNHPSRRLAQRLGFRSADLLRPVPGDRTDDVLLVLPARPAPLFVDSSPSTPPPPAPRPRPLEGDRP